MQRDEVELRARLRSIWKQLVLELRDSEFPAYLVYDTLSEVAIEGMVQAFGASGATSMLRLRADAIEGLQREDARDLIGGGAREDQRPA